MLFATKIHRISIALGILLSACTHVPIYTPEIIVPDDVENYIKDKEKQVAELKPNTQKKIFWYTEPNNKSDYSMVFIHGFAGSRLVQEPALSNLAHSLKANYFATRIRGHGQPSKYMYEATAENWLYDTQEALEIGKKIGNKVIAICHSTGCPALITQLSTEPQNKYHAAIMISPNYGPRNSLSEALLWPGGLNIAKKIHGTHGHVGKTKMTPQEVKMKKHYQNRIDASATEVYPIDAALHVMHVVNQARNINNEHIKIPILVIYSRHDESVNEKYILKYTSKYINAPMSSIHTAPNKIDISNHIHIGQFSDPSSNKTITKLLQKFIQQPTKTFHTDIL